MGHGRHLGLHPCPVVLLRPALSHSPTIVGGYVPPRHGHARLSGHVPLGRTHHQFAHRGCQTAPTWRVLRPDFAGHRRLQLDGRRQRPHFALLSPRNGQHLLLRLGWFRHRCPPFARSGYQILRLWRVCLGGHALWPQLTLWLHRFGGWPHWGDKHLHHR